MRAQKYDHKSPTAFSRDMPPLPPPQTVPKYLQNINKDLVGVMTTGLC